jgi:hypothetical protein
MHIHTESLNTFIRQVPNLKAIFTNFFGTHPLTRFLTNSFVVLVHREMF